MAAKSFYQVLTDAIDDIVTKGFDSAERINYWQEELKRAAEATMMPPHQMDEILQRSMREIYRRMVENHGILKYHAGIPRWTIEKLKPQLRLELDRRILASANLVKLNRQETIAQILRRFSGWSTSIPAGGTDLAGRQKIKDEIRKPLASSLYHQRLVATDQGHKFISSLNQIVATDGGALAAIWHDHHAQANYHYRPDHKARDGKVFAIRGNRAIEKGLMKPGPSGYTDEIEQPGEFVNCRCFYQYLYAIRSLPDDMLTARGREEMVRTKVA